MLQRSAALPLSRSLLLTPQQPLLFAPFLFTASALLGTPPRTPCCVPRRSLGVLRPVRRVPIKLKMTTSTSHHCLVMVH